MHTPHIAFLGGGNMASAIISGTLQTKLPTILSVIDTHEEQRASLERQFDIQTFEHIHEIKSTPDFWVLAIKPQSMKAALIQLLPHLQSQQVIISIAAGLSIATLQKWLNHHEKIVRAMPNTPAMVKQGMTGIYAPLNIISEYEKTTINQLLNSIGKSIWVQTEAEIDSVTAISGSGPAYVFNMMEHLINTAQNFGFSESIAKQLVLQTFKGAVTLAEQSNDDLATLRIKVTSKGGTTAAALDKFNELGLGNVISQGVQEAKKRAISLSIELAQIPDTK